jgi:hypothetical protein
MPHEEGIYTVSNVTGEVWAVCGIDVDIFGPIAIAAIIIITLAVIAYYAHKGRRI